MSDIHWNTWSKIIDAHSSHTLHDLRDFVCRTNDQIRTIFVDCTPADTDFTQELWTLTSPGKHQDDYLVALSAGEIIAVARISCVEREKGLDCAISYFGVRSDYRGKGLGNKLMQRIKRYAKDAGAHRLVADIAHQPSPYAESPLIFYGDHKFRPLDKLGPAGSTRVALVL